MGRLTRLTLLSSAIGAGVGAAFMPNPASAAPMQAPATTQQATAATVVVSPGDTLSAIAARLGVTWPALASYNQLANPDLILVGQQLRVPPPGWSGPDPIEPSGVPGSSSSSSSSSFEQCVIERESGGNADARNGAYWGLYQFSYSTWVANGGSPADYGRASAAEQHDVFARSSASNWAPYDGC
jgi:LysM repeat protein